MGVGLHFLPLVRILHDPLLAGLGIAVTAVAVVATVVQATTGTAAGTGIGALLLMFAVYRLTKSWAQVRANRSNAQKLHLGHNA